MIKQTLCILFLFAATIGNLQGQDVWQDVFTVTQESGNLYVPAQWSPKEGLVLDVRNSSGRQHVRLYVEPQNLVAATASAAAQLVDTRSWFDRTMSRVRGSDVRKDEQPIPHARYDAGGLPQMALENVEVVLKVRPGVWTVYVRNYPVMRIPEPFKPPMTVALPQSKLSADGSSARFQRVVDFSFAADFMVPAEEENQLGDWEQQSGEWHIHSALEDAMEQNPTRQIEARPLEAQRSANFYALNGAGEDGMITSGYSFLDNYELEASMRLDAGEMGLVFYHQGARDYYEMTLSVPEARANRVLVRLRRFSSTRIPRRKLLAAVEAELTPGQWVMPRIQVFDDRIVGYVDNTRVFTVNEPTPVGGRFGLSVRSAQFIRYDDVSVRPLSRLELEKEADVRFHTSAIIGDFYGPESRWVEGPMHGAEVIPRVSSQDKALIVGSTSLQPHVFQARMQQLSPQGRQGLIVGFRGTDQPYLRFVRKVDGEGETFTLEQVENGKVQVVEESFRPAGERTPARVVTLMADPMTPHQLRLYSDGKLALVHDTSDSMAGALGIYVGAESQVRVSGLRCWLERPGFYHSLEEKNQIYASDPYMRHWSSPEGQWVNDDAGLLWHKSDFLGRFELHMPYQSGTQIHLGVAEGESTGEVIVTVKDHSITLRRSATDEVLATAKLVESWPQISAAIQKAAEPGFVEGGVNDFRRYAFTIHHEDGWLWLTDHEEKLLTKLQLGEPLQGRRIRLADYTFDHLMYSHVVNYHQKDYLFAHAPHDWTVNGGRWQIINRFQCDPRWSHFNGESADNLAALWAKYRFGGDFCVEMYVGVRHGWYAQATDLNLTIMNQTTSTRDGYTFVATGWDPNESQLWNRLYKNGKLVDSNTEYTVPRNREGQRRESQHPLIGSGRDMHGAWYAIKVRRVGEMIEYYFDNRLIFSYRDSDPIDAGSIGLWTYRNSMMVARLRVSAERIEPLPIRFRDVPLRDERYEVAPPNEVKSPLFTSLHNNGSLVNQTVPGAWTLSDDVGMGLLTWHLEQRREPYFVYGNHLGGGSMKVWQEDAQKLPGLAGWRFQMKRTEDARLNFHYSVGYLKPQSKDGSHLEYVYTPLRHYYHHISGETFDDSIHRQFGSSEVHAQPRGDQWHRQGAWQDVSVWLPRHDFAGLSVPEHTPAATANGDAGILEAVTRMLNEKEHPKDLYVRIEGFGLLQPSKLHTGLEGNAPGTGYAVKAFTPVRYEPPQLTLADPQGTARRYLLLDSRRQKVLLEGARLQEINTWLARQNYDGLQQVVLRAVGSNGKDFETELSWINLPDEPQMACLWDDRDAYTLRLVAQVPYADPRFYDARLTVDGQVLPLITREPGVRVARLPRSETFVNARGDLAVKVSSGEYAFGKTMNLHGALAPRRASPSDVQGEIVDRTGEGAPRHGKPVLYAIDGPFGMVETFESGNLDSTIFTGATTLSLRHNDPEQGSYLRTANTILNQRLQLSIAKPFTLSSHPLLQFRYRGSEQARISLRVGTMFYINLGEQHFEAAHNGRSYSAQSVRFGTPLSEEPVWKSWMGMISDVAVREPLNLSLLESPSLVFSSFHQRYDQTGRYSSIDYDDIVLGPAVNSGKQLTFTPSYFGFASIRKVNVAILPGPVPYHERDAAELRNIAWVEAENRKPFTPDLTGLEPGISHLLVTAMDSRGVWSSVTDLPFLYDTKPPEVKAEIVAWNEPIGNGVGLDISLLTGDLAPVDLKALSFSTDGKKVDIAGHIGEITHRPDKQVLRIDYPYIYRQRLDTMNDGDQLELVVDGIRDGAGNEASATTIPIKVDHASDKEGPAWLPPVFPANVNFAMSWEGRARKSPYMTPARGNEVSVHHERGEEPYLRTLTHGANGSITYEPKHWDLSLHTNLAGRLRMPKANDKTVIHITINFSNDRRLIIPVKPVRKGSSYIEVAGEMEFKEQAWVSFDANVYAKAKAVWGVRTADAMVVERITVGRSGAENREALDLQNFMVYTPWRPGNVLKLAAYDASGVADFTYDYQDAAGKSLATGSFAEREIQIADLPLERVDGGWLVIRARDKAGNLSVPLRVPCAPAPLVTPAEEAAILRQ